MPTRSQSAAGARNNNSTRNDSNNTNSTHTTIADTATNNNDTTLNNNDSTTVAASSNNTMDDDGWEWPTSSTAKKYKSSLISFMSYFHNKQYDKDKEFTKEELLQIRPRDIHNWMALKAFGKTRYNVDAGDKPTRCRLNTLDWMKKAVSYYTIYTLDWMKNAVSYYCNQQT